MTKIYATLDADGVNIAENAEIHAFDSEDEARHWLASAHERGLDEGEAITFAAGEWGDCWIKTDKDDFDHLTTPFTPDEVSDWRDNPGGDRHWLTPRANVMVAAIANAEG